MIVEKIENGVYQAIDGERILLTIEALGNNVYRAVNDSFDITAEVTPIDEYSNNVRCIEHKRADKNGRFRKTTKLMLHNMRWLDWILEEKGFVRKKKTVGEE